MNLWQVSEETLDKNNPKKFHSQETVFSIGNGYFCTRGTFEEGYPRQNTATLLYGVFDAVDIAKEELANAPDWTVIKLFVNGERFRLDQGEILGYQRMLDIQTGVLSRTVQWQSPKGTRLRVTAERFASLADEHVGIIRYSVQADASAVKPLDILLRASFDTAQGNYNLMHWSTVDQNNTDGLLWLQSETKKTGVQLAQTMSFTCNQPGLRKEFVNSDIAPSIHLSGTLNPGDTVVAEKLVVFFTSRDEVGDPIKAALEHHQRVLEIAQEGDEQRFVYDRLYTANSDAWQQFWKVADIILEGDDKAQVGIRYNLYQLRINASSHDSRYSIAAKGMTGFGYRGHIFHDTEIFMLPFFTYVLPDFARLLLLYRYHLLPAARKKAASNKHEGAQYPWESTLSGEETTPPSIVHPETGEVIPVLNGIIELHITASIAHAVWQYWKVTSDNEFMRDYGAEILLSTAQFWVSRAEKNEERGGYEYTNVIGPDEWHEHVNNNAYTNYMAKHNIQTALAAWEWLSTSAPEKARTLWEELHLSEQGFEKWRDVADHMYLPLNRETRLFEQFDGFFKLPVLDQEKYKGRTDSYQGIMGVQEVQKFRILKQADVLMLLTVLDDEFDQKTKQVNWDYYYPITDHDYGSSLTPALHVILGTQLGKLKESYDLFMKGTLVDLENLRGNTPEGIHAACAGAVWQAVILGVAGLRVTENGYTTNPRWLDNWTRLAFHFRHKGELIFVDLRRESE